MAEILYRASTTPSVPGSTTAKGTPLTNLEIDGNFKSVNNDLTLKAPLASPTFTGNVSVNSTTALKMPVGTDGQRPSPSTGMLRFNTEAGSFEGYDGAEWGAIGGGGITYFTKTTNYTAESGDGILADTSGGSFTVTLPATPAVGDTISLVDVDDWLANNLIVARNGSTIEGAAEDLTLDISGVTVQLIYSGTTWEVFTLVGSPNYELTSGPKRESTTAAGGQTVFPISGGYSPGLIDVYLNGIKLVNGVDVSVVDGISATLVTPATSGDLVSIISYAAFGVVDALPLSGGSMGGLITFTNGQTFPKSGIDYALKTTNYTATDKDGVLADTSGGAFTVTLPATPLTGYQVFIADSENTWGINNLTVGRNGETISGSATDLICDISGASIQLLFNGTTWDVFAQIGGNGGTAVTLAGTQTLTNKDLTSETNTFPTPFSSISLLAQIQATALSF